MLDVYVEQKTYLIRFSSSLGFEIQHGFFDTNNEYSGLRNASIPEAFNGFSGNLICMCNRMLSCLDDSRFSEKLGC